MPHLIIEPEAEADIASAYDWYERQRAGLGDDFELCLEAGLQSIEQRPKIYQKIYRSVRRAMIQRFPYLVFFVERPKEVIVIAVLHVRQSPETWQKRL